MGQYCILWILRKVANKFEISTVYIYIIQEQIFILSKCKVYKFNFVELK